MWQEKQESLYEFLKLRYNQRAMQQYIFMIQIYLMEQLKIKKLIILKNVKDITEVLDITLFAQR